MRSLYVHIGTHKTGTTSIQAFARKNAEGLRRCGLYVPSAGTPNSVAGHHNIAWQLREDPRFESKWGMLSDLTRELGRVREPSALVSSEDFEYLIQYPNALAHFDEALRAAEGGWTPQYVVCFRRQDRYAVSLYWELRRNHGVTIGFLDFLSCISKQGMFVARGDWCFYFDYDAFVTRWRQCVDSGLIVMDYERMAADGRLLPSFFGALGVGGLVLERSRSTRIMKKTRWRIRPAAQLIASWRLHRFPYPPTPA